jgi:hypothetical protein
VKRSSPVRVTLAPVSEFCMRSGCRENKVLLIPTVFVTMCPLLSANALKPPLLERVRSCACRAVIVLGACRAVLPALFSSAFSRFKPFPRSWEEHEGVRDVGYDLREAEACAC